MSESPSTRPGELGRVAQDEIRFRVEVLSSQARIEEKLGGHDKRIGALESSYRSVTSSVIDGQKEFSKYDGMKIGIGMACAVFLVIGSAVWTIFTYFSSKS